ncbi:alpha/beta-hydrolase [Phlebopus sp. FC_14]|nr:alpha/beta-hydrolase [Phlebopus sp. FC_14]
MDSRYLTFAYKYADDKPIFLDAFLPDDGTDGAIHRPVVIYFHGGGLTVGNKKSWFPSWLQTRLTGHGCFFITADYRLMPPSNGHEILDDIRDVFDFVANKLNGLLDGNTGQHNSTSGMRSASNCRIDSQAIGVAGTSAGGLCAYLAAVHASPKPKVLLSMYGMGGDFLTSHYLTPKSEPFFRMRQLLDPASFPTFLYPGSTALNLTSDSDLSYDPSAGYPTNPRMLLGMLYLQLGTYLDYYLGEHEPSLSATLRSKMTRGSSDDLYQLVPEKHKGLFPQLNVTADWPPTCFVHGSSDTAVKVSESDNMDRLLQEKDIKTLLIKLNNAEHSFDYQEDAEKVYADVFDRAVGFLLDQLPETVATLSQE